MRHRVKNIIVLYVKQKYLENLVTEQNFGERKEKFGHGRCFQPDRRVSKRRMRIACTEYPDSFFDTSMYRLLSVLSPVDRDTEEPARFGED